MVVEKDQKSYSQRLCDLGSLLASIGRHRANSAENFRIVKGLSGLIPKGTFQQVADYRTSGLARKLVKTRSRLLVSSQLFSNSIAKTTNDSGEYGRIHAGVGSERDAVCLKFRH